jgi:DNA repair protein RadD
VSQADFFDEPIPMEHGYPVLLPIQLDLLDRGRAGYTGNIRRSIWQAPCGAGKSVIAAEQTRRGLERTKTVLHIVHRRRLVDQMIWTLAKFKIHASPIMQGRASWDSPVKCASRDTLLAMVKDGCELPRADLIIIDEAHVAARQVQDWYLKNCPDSYWTGYTATPVFLGREIYESALSKAGLHGARFRTSEDRKAL